MSSFQKLLSGKRPLAVYFQSWSCGWVGSGENLDLAKIPSPINVVFLSFAKPNCNYTKGSMTFSGTGLDFSSDFAVVKDAIQILRKRNVVVMLSVGGATYPFDGFNPKAVVDFANDLGVDGIDIDWEPHAGAAEAHLLGPIIGQVRSIYPTGLISIAAFSIGAYGTGPFANSPPSGQNTGMCIPGLQSNGFQLDFICLMSYDASPIYDPVTAFNAYRSYYNGPILIGAEVPPEAWGGHVITLSEVERYSKCVFNDPNKSNGLFVWSYQKGGEPSSMSIINTASKIFNASVPTPAIPTPPKPTPPKPTPATPTPATPTPPKPTPPKPTPATPTPPKPTPATPTPTPSVTSWTSNTLYSTGQIVMYNGQKYSCVQGHSSIITWEPSIYTQALWKHAPAPAPAHSVTNWAQNTLYSIGQIVMYNGQKYSCVQGHSSIITWEPSIYTQALWKAI
jgi:chitinase